MSELSAWDSFYVIVGSAAGALVGLQFAVMTLIAERPPASGPEAGATDAVAAGYGVPVRAVPLRLSRGSSAPRHKTDGVPVTI